MITMKSRKDEIFQAYQELLEKEESLEITWDQIEYTVKQFKKEVGLGLRDAKEAYSLTSQWFSGLVDELGRPVLR
jgi:hypothetical protein